jgi:hypothetical protein
VVPLIQWLGPIGGGVSLLRWPGLRYPSSWGPIIHFGVREEGRRTILDGEHGEAVASSGFFTLHLETYPTFFNMILTKISTPPTYPLWCLLFSLLNFFLPFANFLTALGKE